MKAHALLLATALAAVLSPTPALALDFVLVAESDEARFYIERNVTHTRDAAVAVAQRVGTEGFHKHLLYVRAVDCKRGYGALHWSALDGSGMRKLAEFTLGTSPAGRSVADGAAEHMCAPFDY